MPIIKIGSGVPNCPLCGNKMREVYTARSSYLICTRENCMISINKNDPCIRNWEKLNLLCQFCKKPMKVFVRKDGFMKAQCWDKSHYPYQIMRGKPGALPPELRK